MNTSVNSLYRLTLIGFVFLFSLVASANSPGDSKFYGDIVVQASPTPLRLSLIGIEKSISDLNDGGTDVYTDGMKFTYSPQGSANTGFVGAQDVNVMSGTRCSYYQIHVEGDYSTSGTGPTAYRLKKVELIFLRQEQCV